MLPNIFIIFDTEYTSWKNSLKTNWSKKNEYKELVQISGYKIKKDLNNLKIIDSFNCLIKPTRNKKLSKYFKNLTGIKQYDVDLNGLNFKKALKNFYNFTKYNNEKIPLYSYGNDFNILKLNMNYNKIPKKSKFRKWQIYFKDIRFFFKLFCNTKKYSSGTLYKLFNIEVSDKHHIHNALWDAYSVYISLNYIHRNIINL